MAEGKGMVGGEGMDSGGISNVGVLDLTGMKSTEELAGIRSISRVGIVLVPESLMSELLGVPADLLKEKVSQILLAGNLQAPQELLPLVQVLTVEKSGNISALEEGDEVEERAEP